MSDLRPTGVSIQFDGVERHFLFTLNVIDKVQDHYGTIVLDAMDKLFVAKEQSSAVRFFVKTLLDDEAEREKWKNPESDLPMYKDKELGWLISVENIDEIIAAIMKAYRISVPEADGDEDPNRIGGQQSN